MSYVNTYFGIPGRGEIVRLMLTLSDFSYEDKLVNFLDWPVTKPKTRWGTLPMLALPNGIVSGQSRAILRYLGKLSKIDGLPLYPTNPDQALVADDICDFLEDIWPIFVTDIFQVSPEKRKSNIKQFFSKGGRVSNMLDLLEKNVVGPYAIGDRKTIADVYIFAAFGQWSCGFFQGVSLDNLLNGRPKLASIIGSVGTLPKIRKYYGNKDFSRPDQALWKVYAKFCKL